MEITISFRHIEPDENMKSYIEEKFTKLQKYVETPLDVHVVLSVERKYRYRVDVLFTINGVVINAHETMDDMRAAVDMILDKIERRLTRYREKLKRYRNARPKKELVRPSEPVSKIVVTKTIDAKPMDTEEAAMQLEASGDNFIIFRDSEKGNVCVIYKRKDGNFGLIEASGKAS
ncbi:MAG TPA: ribosome-associated translation inhibitor RaiA [Syntrophorhabdaceae bacterium]|nr:ribosome-associated translation inhibitor RaiA [Syntrophorhabdaceae bacterium]HPU29198.1 ribosome-associated translation inhibitor RaiA [Syntrophorhabdaceae bacterium]